MENKDKVKEITAKIEQGIKDLFESDRYKQYLKVMSKFYRYSYNNAILIMLQKPDATHVAGFNTWKNTFKRNVNRGEKGIQILAPSPIKYKVERDKLDPVTKKPMLDTKGNKVVEEVELLKPYFKTVYVFDISQTSGEPLTDLNKELIGEVDQYKIFLESLKSISPFPVEFKDISSGSKGYCDPINKQIVVKKGMSEIHTIKTLVHEITHADLHAKDFDNLNLDDKKDQRTREVEAESVAYTVCSHFGIDTSEYSFAYLAGWSSSKELQEIKSSLDTIQKQASTLINQIEERFLELQRESVIHDNDIDLDKEKNRDQLGFRPLAELIEEAKKVSEGYSKNSVSEKNIDREERGDR